MAGEQDDAFDPSEDSDDELVIDDSDEEAEHAEAEQQIVQAAAMVELVILPMACTNEGKGAPLGMGIQRYWAQESTKVGVRAAAPVFTAMAEQQGGRKVPALMVYRERWTDERVLEGMGNFPNAARAVATHLQVEGESMRLDAKLFEKDDGKLRTVASWDSTTAAEGLPALILRIGQEIAAYCGKAGKSEDLATAFGSSNVQAILSFIVGLGNLSALQGRVVPTTSDQLLGPLVDAINRDPNLDLAMEAMHAMVDILVPNQPDRAAIPLSLQALQIAAQKRPKDKGAVHHLGLLLRRLGDIPAAVGAFNQAFNLDPKDLRITLGFIEALRKLDDDDNAMKVAQFALERGNEHPAVLAILGQLFIAKDMFDEAEPFLRRAVDEGKVPSAFGDLANVLWDRSQGSQRADDQAEALALLRTAIEQPKLAKQSLDMMLDLWEEEKLEEAAKLLLAAAEKHPGDAQVLTAISNFYLDGDDRARARPWLEKIVALARRSLDDDAFARRQLLSLTVADFDDRYDAASDAARSGDGAAKAAAAVFLREVISADTLYWQPHLLLALCVRESDGDEAALAHLGNAVGLRPNDTEIRRNIVDILRKAGRAREAVEHLRAIVGLNPRDVEPVIELARTMRDANLFEECRQVCSTALQMIPNHPQFTAILASLPPATDGKA
jgi:tetratricopeptide (TPR) repeat protein